MPIATEVRTWTVDANHPQADDANPGTPEAPLLTVNAAAQVAQPGDTVQIRPGIYRERVSPARGGEKGLPITYQGEDGAILRGSEVCGGPWTAQSDRIFALPLDSMVWGTAAYGGYCDERVYGSFQPFLSSFNRGLVARPHAAAVAQMQERITEFERVLAEDSSGTGKANVDMKLQIAQRDLQPYIASTDPRMLRTLGQVFLDGVCATEVERMAELRRLPGTWMMSADGQHLLLHPSKADPSQHCIEISTRHTVFAPLNRGLGWITVRGLVIEHGANHYPTWGKAGWPQVGLLSCRSGHHWVIEDCTVRHAKGIGIDIGQEGGGEVRGRGEFPETLPEIPGDDGEHHRKMRDRPRDICGWHILRRNIIADNGHCGIAGIVSYGVEIRDNIIERNNCGGWTSPWWEFAGIKLHMVFDAVIEGNLVRDNEAHGIWLDNQFHGTRVTRNVIINNLWSGVNVELGRGPVLIDHNIIAHTRHGDGVYGHDIADVTIAHNLIYANAHCGVWFAYCTPRVKPENGCWDIRVLNNMILANQKAAVGLPLPWRCAGNNVSDGNLLMGGGSVLDEGSGPFAPQFVITNRSHCGQFPGICQAEEPQTAEVVTRDCNAALARAGLVDCLDAKRWVDSFTLPLDLWQAATGNDRTSTTTRCTRDSLLARTIAWQFTFDDAVTTVRCAPVTGVTHDWYGDQLSAQPLPGPFQRLDAGENRIVLWPVPKG